MPIVNAVADLLVPAADVQWSPRVSSSDAERSGPAVVAIEGPWGAGKSTLMHLIEKEVISRQAGAIDRSKCGWAKIRELFAVARISRRRGLSIRAALWMLTDIRRRSPGIADARPVPKKGKVSATMPKVLTVRFNPWSHQTSEQIWAGLTKEIVEASRSVQGVDRHSRERYWLAKNAQRLDRHQLRRVAARRLISPLLRVGVFALAVPIVAQLAKASTAYTVLGHQVNAPLVAVLIPATLILLGISHTIARYLLGRARSFLPGEILDGPVLSGAFALDAGSGKENGLRDPYYNARSGYLYLVQHDIRDLLHTISVSGRELIVFIDDLDRCSARTTAEVFEAINLFLSGALQVPQNGVAPSETSCRFVLGLDTSVVAQHLDHAYAGFDSGKGVTEHQDPSWGWTFLRKLIQLSVTVPSIGHPNLVVAMDGLLGPVDTPSTLGAFIVGTDSSETATAEEVAGDVDEEPDPQPAVQEKVLALETHQAVRDRLQDRMSSQRGISMREAKRFLTLWQFYLRVLAYKERGNRGLSVEDAVHLVTLAEVSARWPALQSNLYSRKGGQTGLAVLAPHVEDDVEWARALRRVGIEGASSSAACEGLRSLLAAHEADKVATLAQRIF
ncbi:KAP family NTPase [Streptomyces griseobrunneus]